MSEEKKEKLPMGFVYKYAEKEDSTGVKSKEKIPYFPYTKTSAITNEDNVNLDVILEEIRNFTGYSLTTDITWDKPGVYALDASVASKFYDLCKKVFISADSSLDDLIAAIGITKSSDDNFSSVLGKMRNIMNDIRNKIIAKGGSCPTNPTLMNLYNSILNLDGRKAFSATIAMSYNEFAMFPTISLTNNIYNKVRYIGFSENFINTHIISDNGFRDCLSKGTIYQMDIASSYDVYTKKNTDGKTITYGVEKNDNYYGYGTVFKILDEYTYYDKKKKDKDVTLYNPAMRYKITNDHDKQTSEISFFKTAAQKAPYPPADKMVTFEKNPELLPSERYMNYSSKLLQFSDDTYDLYRCNYSAAGSLIITGGQPIVVSVAFPEDWHTTCFDAAVSEDKYYYECAMDKDDKKQWKIDKNIIFNISGYAEV